MGAVSSPAGGFVLCDLEWGQAVRESQVSREVQSVLKQIGCAVWTSEQGYRKERGGTRTSAGIPDLIVVHPDAWTFAELKNAKGRLTTAQEGFRLACVDAGIPWQLWRSAKDAFDWAESVGIVQRVDVVPMRLTKRRTR